MRYPLSAALSLFAVLTAQHQQSAADLRLQVETYRRAHEAQIVDQLEQLARIKSIAADPAGLAETANRLESLLKERGFETQQLSSGDGAARHWCLDP